MLASKIDYKGAYCQGILHFKTALKTATQLPDKAIAIITLQLTFGGALCSCERGIMLELICNLANELLKRRDWKPKELHALVQQDIPQQQYLDNDAPFASSRELIIDVPINPRGYTDIYIDNTMGLTIETSLEK